MSRCDGSVLSAAALLGAAALLTACSGGNEEVIRQQGELRSRLEAQNGEVEALRTRVKDLEVRSRSLEEQVAAVGVIRHSAPVARTADAAASGDESSGGSAADSATVEVAEFLESNEGKEKLREFMQEEEVKKREADRIQMQERMESFVKERVTGYLTEQLNLTPDQQARVIDISSDAAKKMGEIWAGARGGAGSPPADFQAMREKTDEIRKDAMDQLSQALTVDQYNKLEELGPGAFMGGPGGGRGGRGARTGGDGGR